MATPFDVLQRQDQRAPTVVALDDPRALDPALVGAKAAALARVSRLGLPVLAGVVLTVDADVHEATPPLRRAWRDLSAGGRRALAVGSCAVGGDGATSSMAGQYTSVLDVASWPDLVAAIATVRASAGPHPMAVLLQPMLDAGRGGVLFGLDPVGGRTDRFLVEWVDGGPAGLVGGQVTANRELLTRHGRRVEGERPGLRRRERRELAAAARHLAKGLGGPQDVEWAVDRAGRLWILQSRPVTAAASGATARGPTYGPGPVAETFPAALSPLEQAVWVEPLRSGVGGALEVLGVLPRRTLRRRELVIVVGGRVAADLDLLGGAPKGSLVRRFDPRPPARRLAAAWRVGRLRRALPLLAADVIARVDAELAAIPHLDELDDRRLLDLLRGTVPVLHALHGHEVLAGALGVDEGAGAAGQALRTLAEARAAGVPEQELVARHPAVLALVPPSIGARAALPDVAVHLPEGELSAREALRLRARWVQELSARAAAELGRRRLPDPILVRWLDLDELAAVVDGAALPADLAARAAVAPGPPLPAAFRLDADGRPVASRTSGAGRGAGGGRASGPAHHAEDGEPAPGSVLVTSTLAPELAGWLPLVVGVVAETGSTLSHLAILARELGVPTVVGVPDARRRFARGSTIVLDGTSGEVVAA